MIKFKVLLFLLLFSIGSVPQKQLSVIDTVENYWTKPPAHIPNHSSIDAPLMGNGDVTMSVGYKDDLLRFYLSKNDFWRLLSKSYNLSGPRVVGFVDIQIEGFSGADFSANQLIKNGITSCLLNNGSQILKTKSWVSATDNIIFIELEAVHKAAKISINLAAPENKRAEVKTGKLNSTH